MTTFKGIARSYMAAVHRAEKARKRTKRENQKQEIQHIKEQNVIAASRSVQEFDNYLTQLQSLHHQKAEKLNWRAIHSEPAPEKPERSNPLEKIARENLANYKPSLIAKIFNQKKKLSELDAQIQQAIQSDKANYIDILSKYGEAKIIWSRLQEISVGVLEQLPISYRDAVEFFNPFGSISLLGSSLNMTFEKEYAIAELLVNSREIVPKEIIRETSTGKLSRKNMSVTKSNEIYQDHICSAILKTGIELLSILPIEYVIVHAQAELLNTATGKIETQTILSVAIFPKTLEKLNLEAIIPSDSMTNFLHHMKFNSAHGFSPVQKIEATSIH